MICHPKMADFMACSHCVRKANYMAAESLDKIWVCRFSRDVPRRDNLRGGGCIFNYSYIRIHIP